MNLFRITYTEDTDPNKEYEQHIICNGLPAYKTILKRLNMLLYCGEIMNDKDYKEFVVGLGNYVQYHINSVDEISYTKFEN